LNAPLPIPVLQSLSPRDSAFAVKFVDAVLQAALAYRASDVHFHPLKEGLELRWRLDGVLQPLGVFPRGETSDAVARLKVLADLLTYQSDLPQEGRIRQSPDGVEMRVSTFPTLHGERAVVRIFPSQQQQRLSELGLPEKVASSLRGQLDSSGGVIIISGPAGSGKTTTACACLREIVALSKGQRSIVSLEDPVEVALDGVSQSQVNPQVGLTLDSGLKSLLRQDPEVIFVGEIRDQGIARLVMQAALTGHLVITTFHAGSSAGALSRLLDWRIEPYQLRSGILSILSQRLIRRLCECAKTLDDEVVMDGQAIVGARGPAGCDACAGTGYRGRMLLAEWLDLTAGGAKDLFQARDRQEIEEVAIRLGMTPLRENGRWAVTQGWTSPQECLRALGS
jgi:general secretion pathway protein E